MCKKVFALLVVFFWLVFSTPLVFAQVSEEELLKAPEKIKSDPSLKISLSLKLAQEKAVKANIALQQARIDLELAELAFKTAHHTMYLPKLELGASVTGAYTYGNFSTRKAEEIQDTYDKKGYPSTSYTLTLGEYTLYNGGRDQLSYQLAKVDWERAKESYADREREARLKAISQYARYQTDSEKLDAANRYLSLSVSLARLIKTRVRLGRATKDEFSSALNDILEARNSLEEAKVVAEASLWELNKALGDAIGQEYKLESKLEFRPLKLTLQEAAVLYKMKAPSLLEQKANLERKRLALELARRDQVPTPKITLSPIKISYSNSYTASSFGSPYNSNNSFVSDSSGSNNNLDVGFSLSLSIPIFTESGFFGSRNVAAAQLAADREQLQSLTELQSSDTQIRQFMQQISKQESLVKNSQQLLKNTVELLDSLFERLNSTNRSGTSRLEIRDSLRSSFEAEIAYREALLSHLSQKFDFAKFLGVDLDENVDF